MDERARLLDKMEKLRDRLRGTTARMPAGDCTDVATHLAGLFFKEHVNTFIEAVRRMD